VKWVCGMVQCNFRHRGVQMSEENQKKQKIKESQKIEDNQMSDEFIDSQVKYFRSILNCGPSRDWNRIAGSYAYYLGLQNSRKG
jgi:hypothetical protein